MDPQPIRPAREGDLPALAALGRSPLDLLDLCRAAGTLWVADDRTGYLAAGEVDGALLILDLHVDPGHRRRGLGSALLRKALDHAAWAFHPAAVLTADRETDKPYFARFGFLELRPEALAPGIGARYVAQRAQARDPGRICVLAKRL